MSSRAQAQVRRSMDLVSSTFNAQASLAAAKGAPFDVVLVSSDGVRFHTHKSVLHAASSNRFDGLLPQAQSRTSSVRLSDGSLTLDLVLHAVYGLALGPYAPTWATLERAVAAMDRYAVPLPRPTDPLFIALLANLQRPGGALDLYCLAAHHSLESLAVAASAHLLSLELNTLTDAWAAHCGAVYLNRLFLLHLHRTDAIKRILSVPPAQHAHTPGCIEEDKQRDVARPWALAVAMLIMEARPDLPALLIQTTLNTVADGCSCVQCRELVAARIQAVLREWSAVKRTI